MRKNVAGLYEMTWRTSGKRKGAHVLTAVASDVRGREAEASADRSHLQVIRIQATRFGKPLPDGGTIGVAAAASPYDSRSDVLRGVEWWEARGYSVKLADRGLGSRRLRRGQRRARAEDLNALFADPEVDVVQALQGGFGSAQAIPYLDFDLIAANPKPLVGYSDITALHVAIRQNAGLATIYGNGLMGVGARRRRRSRRIGSSTSCGRAARARCLAIRTIRGCARFAADA